MIKIGKYSFGIGDRFGHQGEAQLRAIIEASRYGVDITPVWNKSNREHIITRTEPAEVRHEADSVTRSSGFKRPYFVDADHINNENADRFIESSDYFTIDVSSYIGRKANVNDIISFMEDNTRYSGDFRIPGTGLSFYISENDLYKTASNYLLASISAKEIFRKIEKVKGKGNFVTEISMDEVPHAQSPVELFFILEMMAAQDIPLQTIAPKFTGRFNKGVDYEGDTHIFEKEFEADLMIIDYAVKQFGLPENLKISVHSGSDKFSLYPVIGSLIKKHDKGIHIKTAGTTWLEEVIGLAESGGKGLDFVRDIYKGSLDRMKELSEPYADVIKIVISSLPSADDVTKWDGEQFADALRHTPGNRSYNPGMRQLMHIAYKLAAEKKEEFYNLLLSEKDIIEKNVFINIFERHICRLFDINP
jgi:hypothetical protein